MTSNALSIGELSRRSGLSAHTLRFYEAQAILQPAGRNASGHRQYRSDDLLWLGFVQRLKTTGMPLAEIKHYAALRAQGEETAPARLALLQQHRERLRAQIEELAHCARALDDKIGIYHTLLGTTPASTQETTP